MAWAPELDEANGIPEIGFDPRLVSYHTSLPFPSSAQNLELTFSLEGLAPREA